MKAQAWRWGIALATVAVLFVAELFFGQVVLEPRDVVNALFNRSENPVAQLIVSESRLPRALTAMLAGAGLALAGLLMQRYFHNPLAGPGVLGISSGAGLGVALVVMAGLGGGSIVGAAFAGAMAVLALVLVFARRMPQPVSLLIFGLMTGYLVSAVVTIVQAGTTSEALRSFVFWGMGSFADLNDLQVGVLALAVIPSIFLAYRMHRRMDLWSLGESYARSSGLNVARFRWEMLLATGLITGAVTAYCGPVAFIGLAVPHVARGIWQSGRHAVLVPAVVVSGMAIGLVCDLLVRLPIGAGGLPLNAVTAFFGAPVVIALLLKGRRVF